MAKIPERIFLGLLIMFRLLTKFPAEHIFRQCAVFALQWEESRIKRAACFAGIAERFSRVNMEWYSTFINAKPSR
jgi:hypothetical protein